MHQGDPISTQISLKEYLYRVIEESPEDNVAARRFNIFMTVLIIVNVLAVILETVEPLYQEYSFLFIAIDIISIAFFTIEYFIRLWICTLNPEFTHPVTGRLRYMVSAFALIDLLSFLPFYIPFIIPFDLRFIRILRLFRLIRVMKLGRFSDAMKRFNAVIAKKREELIIALSILLVVLVFASSMMYYAEHDAQPEKFASIPAAMWWGIITLATVGYGDIYPVTAIGKIIGSVVLIAGIGVFALPTAILSAGLIEESRKECERDNDLQEEVTCPACGHHFRKGMIEADKTVPGESEVSGPPEKN